MNANQAAACCQGKDKLTRKQAENIVRRASNTFSGQAYRCANCGHWHVGGSNRLHARLKSQRKWQ